VLAGQAPLGGRSSGVCNGTLGNGSGQRRAHHKHRRDPPATGFPREVSRDRHRRDHRRLVHAWEGRFGLPALFASHCANAAGRSSWAMPCSTTGTYVTWHTRRKLSGRGAAFAADPPLSISQASLEGVEALEHRDPQGRHSRAELCGSEPHWPYLWSWLWCSSCPPVAAVGASATSAPSACGLGGGEYWFSPGPPANSSASVNRRAVHAQNGHLGGCAPEP
jgi:hypothetical protein